MTEARKLREPHRKQLLKCQHLYFCINKASKLNEYLFLAEALESVAVVVRRSACESSGACDSSFESAPLRQYLYFCTSKASKLSTFEFAPPAVKYSSTAAPPAVSRPLVPGRRVGVSICPFVLVK